MTTESTPDAPPFEVVARRSVYANRFVEVFDDEVRLPDGSAGAYLRVVEGQDTPGVAMLALARGRIALVRTYRHAVGAWEWGIPRGFGQDADPLVSARAELREELGAEPETLSPLTTINPNSGLLATTVHLVLAHYAEPSITPADTAEVAAIRWVALDDLLADIGAGAITDAFTLAAITAGFATSALPQPARARKAPAPR